MSENDTSIEHGDVGDVSSSVTAQADRIESDIGNLVGLYEEDVERIRERTREFDRSLNPYDVDLEEAGISDEVDLDSETDLSVDIEADNVGKYVERLSESIERVGADIAEVKDSMDATGGSAEVTRREMADTMRSFDTEEVRNSLEGGRLEDMVDRLEKIEKADKVNQRQREQELEDYRSIKQTLEEELVEAVTGYASEVYDTAVDVADEIAGDGPGKSEMERLDDISGSRQAIIRNAADPSDYRHVGDVAGQEEPLEVSRDALVGQGLLIGQMAIQMKQAINGTDSLLNKVESLGLDRSGDVSYAVEARDSIEAGYDNLVNAVEGDYDTLEEAVRDKIEQGLMEDESFSDQYSGDFRFETMEVPYVGSLEEA